MVSIARAFEEINDVQGRAELESRLDLLEEQVERLASRRDEVDQAIHAELNVMRTRIESALEAAGSVAPRQQPGLASLALGRAGEVPAAEGPADALPAPYRKEIERHLLQARSDLRFELFELQKQLKEALRSPQLLEDMGSAMQDRMEAAESRACAAAESVSRIIREWGTAMQRERARQSSGITKICSQLAELAALLEPEIPTQMPTSGDATGP